MLKVVVSKTDEIASLAHQRLKASITHGERTVEKALPRCGWERLFHLGPAEFVAAAGLEELKLEPRMVAVVVRRLSVEISTERVEVRTSQKLAERLSDYGYEFAEVPSEDGDPPVFKTSLEPVELLDLGVCLSEQDIDVGLFPATVDGDCGRLLILTEHAR